MKKKLIGLLQIVLNSSSDSYGETIHDVWFTPAFRDKGNHHCVGCNITAKLNQGTTEFVRVVHHFRHNGGSLMHTLVVDKELDDLYNEAFNVFKEMSPFDNQCKVEKILIL